MEKYLGLATLAFLAIFGWRLYSAKRTIRRLEEERADRVLKESKDALQNYRKKLENSDRDAASAVADYRRAIDSDKPKS